MHLIFVFLFELYLFFEKIEEVLFTFRLVSRNRVKLHSSGTNCHFKWLPTEQFTDCDVLITIKYFPELSFVTLFWEISENLGKGGSWESKTADNHSYSAVIDSLDV